MSRIILCLALLLAPLLLGGCVSLREKQMEAMSRRSAFNPEGSRVTKRSVSGYAAQQSVGFRLELEYTGSCDDAAEWILGKLKPEGWIVVENTRRDSGSRSLWLNHPTVPFLPTFYEILGAGINPVTNEDGTTVTVITMNFDGYYWWDLPALMPRMFLVLPFMWMGEGAEYPLYHGLFPLWGYW